MYHEEFYKNSMTGEITYSRKEAEKWSEQGVRVYHYHHDGGCTFF